MDSWREAQKNIEILAGKKMETPCTKSKDLFDTHKKCGSKCSISSYIFYEEKNLHFDPPYKTSIGTACVGFFWKTTQKINGQVVKRDFKTQGSPTKMKT